ncbi:MAG TPA: Gfo/Idh/MocA family oxidoreductase, partial [Pseudonocardiaceae bacterium]
FAARFGAAPFTDLGRLLRTARPELLVVALPPFAHEGQVEAAAAAGVHLLVEKPPALTQDRADAMVAAAAASGVVAACGFMYRFGDALARWDAADTGRAGLFAGHFHCNSAHAPWWRSRALSGGQVVEQLVHLVDLARHHLGEPRRVYARAATFFHGGEPGYDADDVSALVLGYDDGRVGVLNATNGAVPGVWDKRWEVVAERMTGHFTGWNTATLTAVPSGAVERVDGTTDVVAAQLADVVAAIRAGRPPRVPLADGAATLRVVMAAARSATEGREVRL